MISRIACAIPLSLLLCPAAALASDPVDLAASLIGRPYVWGAEGPDSFDCSGLTQYVFQEFGIQIPRRAISQSKSGEPIGRRPQRGDLLFFASDTRRSLVTHVGIYEGGGTMIEASKRYGRVRRDNVTSAYWMERFMFGRRYNAGAVASRRPDRDDVPIERPSRTNGRRRAAIRVLGALAEVLIRRSQR